MPPTGLIRPPTMKMRSLLLVTTVASVRGSINKLRRLENKRTSGPTRPDKITRGACCFHGDKSTESRWEETQKGGNFELQQQKKLEAFTRRTVWLISESTDVLQKLASWFAVAAGQTRLSLSRQQDDRQLLETSGWNRAVCSLNCPVKRLFSGNENTDLKIVTEKLAIQFSVCSNTAVYCEVFRSVLQ